jgi:hypothetical protein
MMIDADIATPPNKLMSPSLPAKKIAVTRHPAKITGRISFPRNRERQQSIEARARQDNSQTSSNIIN